VWDRSNAEPVIWSKCKVEEFDKIPTLPEDGIWLKPQKWNAGGYDAIFINKKEKLVRFVQVANGDSQVFKIEYFSQFLQQLLHHEPSFDIQTLEIVFLVPETKISSFQLTPVTGQGSLSAYPGWEQGDERDSVKILSMERWDGTC